MNEQQSSRSLILTIDDDDMMRIMLHDILEREGFEVVSVSNAMEGIEVVKTQQPELVLLDVIMPEMDGFECLQAIRAIPGMELLPVVMLTGVDDIASINKSFQLGATDFIAKPISWPTLPHRLRYFLRASNALSQLAKSESELRTAQKIARLGSWEWSVADDKMQWSDEVFNLLGLLRSDFTGHRADLFKRLAGPDADKLSQAFGRCVKNKQDFHLECQIHDPSGTDSVVVLRGEPFVVGNRVMQIQGTIQDITERRRIEEQLRFLSYYDPLTRLPNRKLFNEILGQDMAHCNQHNETLSVLFISIDGFKQINEALGTSVTDQIVKFFAERLIAETLGNEHETSPEYEPHELVVSRLTASEFSVLINKVKDSRDSVKVVKRIFQIVEKPFNIDEHEVYLSMSVGIAVYPGDGEDEDTFIKNGKFAMYDARDRGQNNYQFFSKSLNVAAFHKLSMANNLRRAIERDELLLCYHAKVNIRQKRVIGCEALIRWQHPELGLMPPLQFLPIAEDAGLMTYINNWVLESACTQMLAWLQEGLPLPIMAVNVSATQFRQPGFADHVQLLLERLGLPHQYLKLELTESILLEGIKNDLEMLKKLTEIGVQVSIDDFGTGFSSLAYLKKLPISEIKIDRSFIRDIPNNEDDMAITTAILALAKSLSLDVVAEGVEHQAQVDFLLEEGCEIAQGFLYSKPLPAKEFAAFVLEFNG